MYYIGVMSGTSLDGIDAVLVDFSGDNLKVVSSISEEFPNDLKAQLVELLKTFTIHLQDLGELETYLSLCYAKTINKLLKNCNVSKEEVIAVGCHGQTIFHNPICKYPFTTQLINGNIIAFETGLTCVVDFRRMDVAAGGNGAPLVPAFHADYFHSDSDNRVILNLGGIANSTILPAKKENVIGFDHGPANCLMDIWLQEKLNLKYDKGGEIAKSGKVNQELLNLFLQDIYFSLPLPKSTGKELFNLEWIYANLAKVSGTISNEDIIATLCELTAISVANDIKKYASNTNTLFLCGGGAYNDHLSSRFAYHLPGVEIKTTQELGVSPQLVEGIAFAWLTKGKIEGFPTNLPSVTGASQFVELGTIYKVNS